MCFNPRSGTRDHGLYQPSGWKIMAILVARDGIDDLLEDFWCDGRISKDCQIHCVDDLVLHRRHLVSLAYDVQLHTEIHSPIVTIHLHLLEIQIVNQHTEGLVVNVVYIQRRSDTLIGQFDKGVGEVWRMVAEERLMYSEDHNIRIGLY